MTQPDSHEPTAFTSEQGFIEGCTKDKQSITSDWVVPRQLIDGIRVKEVKSVLTDRKVLTEVIRRDWCLDGAGIDQVFQVQFSPGAITAWHAHQFTTDRLFVNSGQLKIVLYDARQGSRTFGTINEFRWGSMRPALICVPAGVWHGVQNDSKETASLLNIVDKAYCYEDPDHWRLPWNTDKIPYSFSR